jgi:hypothetical protein
MLRFRRPTMLASGVVLTTALTLVGGVSAAGAKTVRVAATASGKIAGSDAISNGLPAGYDDFDSPPITATNGTQTRGTVSCGGTSKPVGGGAQVVSSSTSVNLNDSFPVGKNGWAVDVNNTSGANTTFIVFVMCLTRGPAGFTINTAPFTATADSQYVDATASCPAGVVLGGGVFSTSSSTSVDINSSFPNSTTSWRIDMNNATGTASNFTVYSICKNTAPSKYHLVAGPAVDNPAGAQTEVTGLCPGSGEPLSGGVSSSSTSTAVSVGSTRPDNPDWLSDQNNASSTDATATPYVICAGNL